MTDTEAPVSGIVDVLDNRAFIRTSGYLPGADDVLVSKQQLHRYGLRRGDMVTGTAQPGGRQRTLVRVDSVQGKDPDQARDRPDFYRLTPVYPTARLRLETDPHQLTTRLIDLLMPLGKGQRALVVAPPKTGKTTILQAIGTAITRNHPECHLMAVLIDERPEEVTEMRRALKGEVVASTFDRPPHQHTAVAELAIERAKRLVEQGEDVVVLLDSITRLGRAYNNASRGSGRVLTGGVDAAALYPPKRFLGAARNLEEGGSLTIVATALVENGSAGDTVIFEEYKGTGNAELKLDRRSAERRVFPAVDIDPTGTRKEELLYDPAELAIVRRLRLALQALDGPRALDQILEQLRRTSSNAELLMALARAA